MKSLDLYVLLTLFAWGIWGIVDKKALQYAKQEDVMMRLYLLAFFWVPTGFLLLNILLPGAKPGFELLLWSGLAALSYAVALFAYL
ncbi:MAG: hypothetical protein K2X27_06355, partial [Candidatus Obscuribacterales bacterium]|nr:hypothetical protein [Candidatus Obscuribacterales bacterium]